jgi:hypothetical protein
MMGADVPNAVSPVDIQLLVSIFIAFCVISVAVCVLKCNDSIPILPITLRSRFYDV